MKKIFLILFSILSISAKAEYRGISSWEYDIPDLNFIGRAYDYKSLKKCFNEARKDAYQKALIGTVGAFVSLEKSVEDVKGGDIKYIRVMAFDADQKYYGFSDAFVEKEKQILNNPDGTYDCFVRIETTKFKVDKLRDRNWKEL